MKRRAVLILGLALMLGMNGCGNSDETVDSNIEQKEDIELEEAIELDVFEGLQVSFEGFNGKGKIKIDTSNCSKEVREYVQFEYETSMDGKLSNEQNIVISAVSKHENLKLVKSSSTCTIEDGEHFKNIIS